MDWVSADSICFGKATFTRLVAMLTMQHDLDFRLQAHFGATSGKASRWGHGANGHYLTRRFNKGFFTTMIAVIPSRLPREQIAAGKDGGSNDQGRKNNRN